jgi:non-ribosomal peptide synthetase component E (peptide arylation enzyme)
MQVEEFLETSARRVPDKVALISGEKKITYREIEENSNRLAHGLLALGIQRGDRVGI